MSRRQIGSAAFVLACALVASSATANASDGYYGSRFGSRYSIYSTESIPYFAEFPPVYYSQPVPRSYGFSPYAYPAGVLTPEPVAPPKITINPYVKPKSKSTNVAGNRSMRPLRIRNPFVVDSGVQLSQAETP